MHLKTLRRSPRLLLALDQCRLIYKPVHSLLWAFSVFSGDVEWSKRWQHEVYNDLTCHVAVYLCGPQRTTPIWINEVEAWWAATQLVGLTGRLVNGCKMQSGTQISQSSKNQPTLWRLSIGWVMNTQNLSKCMNSVLYYRSEWCPCFGFFLYANYGTNILNQCPPHKPIHIKEHLKHLHRDTR